MAFASEYKRQLLAALDVIDLVRVEHLIEVFHKARDEDRQIFVFGNGGSAATANHFACDIVKGASYGRDKRFRILALSEADPDHDRLFQRRWIRERLRRAAQELRPIRGYRHGDQWER